MCCGVNVKCPHQLMSEQLLPQLGVLWERGVQEVEEVSQPMGGGPYGLYPALLPVFCFLADCTRAT